MRVLVYKRTHRGDPDSQGWFGCDDCMGKVRSYHFDAVIGIGGICALARAHGISQKLNWVGTGARKQRIYERGHLVTFRHFAFFEESNLTFHALAPTLATRLLNAKGPRFLFSDRFNDVEWREVNEVLALAESAPASALRYKATKGKNNHRCSCGSCPRCVSSRGADPCPRRSSCVRT